MKTRLRIFWGLFFLLVTNFNLLAQNNTFPTTGNVGIGTTSPAQSLEVDGMVRITTMKNRYLQIGGLGVSDNFAYISSGGQSNGTGLKFETTNGPSVVFGATRMTILNDGNVGIGTTSPLVKLHVNHSGTGQSVILAHGADINFRLVTRQDQTVNSDGSVLSELGMEYGTARNTGIRFHRGFSTTGGFMSFTTDSGIERLRITTNGNVGIGTAAPGHKLDVIGTVRAREVKVDMSGADFVFEEDYGLMPLEELEAFIKANKHLPEIETAAEMEAEGVELGELNTKLLQKIEELTLYLLIQDKAIENLNNENRQLKDLDSRIRILENQSK
ncbi:hypothetical protein [Algoriphagus sp. A40]|uniref:hypothetical protein n=1 Tax=Algoriphagus sp. A40 TaxID=1945863 RepID=UPI000986BA73|nr:hypothetical protein [Algoriphagus sp. A40]OOG76425.1 hypothetical protein B0E43_08010 [Algoriphagus sp. A40]